MAGSSLTAVGVEGAEDFVGRMDEGEDSGEDRDESRVGQQEEEDRG